MNIFETFLVAMDTQDDKRKLLYYYTVLRRGARHIQHTTCCRQRHIHQLLQNLNRLHQRYKFRIAKPLPEESMDTYVTHLRELAQGRAFADVDDEMITRVIVSL